MKERKMKKMTNHYLPVREERESMKERKEMMEERRRVPITKYLW